MVEGEVCVWRGVEEEEGEGERSEAVGEMARADWRRATWSIDPASRCSTSIAEAIFSAFVASMPRSAPSCDDSQHARVANARIRATARATGRGPGLLKGDVAVELRDRQHVVLGDRAVKNSGTILESRHLVRRQRRRERLDLLLAQQPVHEHLLEHLSRGAAVKRPAAPLPGVSHREIWQLRGALVLVQRAEEARALWPSRGENRAPGKGG